MYGWSHGGGRARWGLVAGAALNWVVWRGAYGIKMVFVADCLIVVTMVRVVELKFMSC